MRERTGPSVTYGRLYLASLVTHSHTGAFSSVISDSFNTPIDDTNLDKIDRPNSSFQLLNEGR